MQSMFYLLRKFIFVITGPDLIRVPTGFRTPTVPYAASGFEKLLTFGIRTSNICIGLVKWTVLLWLPITITNIYHWSTLLDYFKLCSKLSVAYISLFILRGISRLMNSSYQRFVTTYLNAEDNMDQNLIDALTLYGFRYPWPAQFDVRDLDQCLILKRKAMPPRYHETSNIMLPFIWLIANTIGIRIVYPGCLGIINNMTIEPRMEALDSLRASYRIRRVGILTREGLFVESFYADRRSDMSPNGGTLVICCEGNAGFAEIGTASTPLTAGYSVLTWNHPGFGSSMGMPFPEQDANAMEAVLLFATQYLHFELADIRLFGWSIGGFAVTWAGMQLPNIGGMILDATFDTLDEFAKKALPFIKESISLSVVRRYFDLNNIAQIIQYPGPILLIRRSRDEVISANSPDQRLSNRGNNLLFGLLKYRFPNLFNVDSEAVLWKYLGMDRKTQEAYLEKHAIVDDVIAPILLSKFRKELLNYACTDDDDESSGLIFGGNRSLAFPSRLGDKGLTDAMKRSILIYLTSKYFVEVEGTHCSPLDPADFKEPWSESFILKRPQTFNTDTEANNGDEINEENDWEQLA